MDIGRVMVDGDVRGVDHCGNPDHQKGFHPGAGLWKGDNRKAGEEPSNQDVCTDWAGTAAEPEVTSALGTGTETSEMAELAWGAAGAGWGWGVAEAGCTCRATCVTGGGSGRGAVTEGEVVRAGTTVVRAGTTVWEAASLLGGGGGGGDGGRGALAGASDVDPVGAEEAGGVGLLGGREDAELPRPERPESRAGVERDAGLTGGSGMLQQTVQK